MPEPPLKSMASVFARSMIDSIESSTELMKQALACCFVFSTPRLNQTGLLKAIIWFTSRCFSSVAEALAVGGRLEVATLRCPNRWMRSATRPISCLTLRSRSGVPMWPRKYFETTTFVASCDQDLGISTSVCSKTVSPPSPEIFAERSSHSTASKGSTSSFVKKRST